MSTTVEQVCLNGAKLADSWGYRLILVPKFISCLLGILGTSYVIKNEVCFPFLNRNKETFQGIRWLAHPNAKIVYAVHLFWTSYIPLAFMVPMGFDFIR